jgi:hypothetical protein
VRRPRRIALDIAQQQLKELAAQPGCTNDGTGLGNPTNWLADLLVMGEDRRPYLVRRLVAYRAGGAGKLCWVSVSAADSTKRLRHPVIREVVTVRPRLPLNVAASLASIRDWNHLDKRG